MLISSHFPAAFFIAEVSDRSSDRCKQIKRAWKSLFFLPIYDNLKKSERRTQYEGIEASMKKNLGVVQAVYPMPVLMVAAYDENGKVNVMNAAWGMK